MLGSVLKRWRFAGIGVSPPSSLLKVRHLARKADGGLLSEPASVVEVRGLAVVADCSSTFGDMEGLGERERERERRPGGRILYYSKETWNCRYTP